MYEDYEHPDITAALRTGYPLSQPQNVNFPITPAMIRSYINDDDVEFKEFCISNDDYLFEFINDAKQKTQFEAWAKQVLEQ